MAPKLNKVIRLDSLPANQTFFTPEGYLMDRPILTSVGIFEYTNPDGSVRRELRLPDEVFAAESLRSYQGKPIIITHDAGLVDKENVHDESVGTILSEGYRDGDDVRAQIVIHDTDEMKDCGLKELSLGYNLDLDETPGEWNGMPYDAIQRNIRINHLALVREARAGDQARLNIDGRDSTKILKGGKAMSVSKKSAKKTRRADGVLSPEALKSAIEAYKAKRAARIAAKADEDAPAEEVVSTKPEGVAADNDTVVEPAAGDKTIEEKVEMVKDRRDRRDSEGDPESTEEAIGVIANQDDDMDILFDIIDTLLAEREFDNAGETNEPETAEDEGEEETGETAETGAEAEEENEDEEGEEEGEAAATETEEAADGECESENLDEDEDPIPSADPSDVNLDSIDKVVRERVRIGMIGRTLNMDGLEEMPLAKAKRAIIKAVRPGIRLDGKSKAYINAAFDCACDEIKARSKKDTSYQKKQMFNKDGRTSNVVKSSAASARDRMIARQHKKEEK